MNLREGRIGRQEAACLAAFGVAVNGLVYPNDAALYAHGNAAYLAAPLSLLLLLPAFALVARAMERRASAHLGGFLCDALGGLAGRAAALAVIGYLIVSAAVPLIQFLLSMHRYVFPNSSVQNIALYFLPPLIGLSLAGLETLGRTARICLWPFALMLLLPLLLAIPMRARCSRCRWRTRSSSAAAASGAFRACLRRRWRCSCARAGYSASKTPGAAAASPSPRAACSCVPRSCASP